VDSVAPAHRELCLRCRRPASVCWCGDVTRVPSATRVVFLQHPRESRVPVSTCRMAHLSLPNSELHIGLGATGDARLEAVCREPDVAVLFPSDSAVDVRDLKCPPKTLIVVDGTWSNAKKVVEKCPVLSTLPRVAFTPDKPGNYRIRKEPEAHCVSTIEAVAYVLEHLEKSPGRFTPMLSAFDAMVERQLDYIAKNGNASRHRRFKVRNSKPVDPAQPLHDAGPRLVTLFGEANAWPLDAPDRPPSDDAELIQVVAERPATGERFEALLAPKRPLSPTVAFHLDLSAAALAQGLPRAEALARLDAFLGPDAVLVGWGRFCVELLEAEAVPPRPFIDLRSVLAQAARGRPGSVEALATRLGATLPDGKGRAARRLVALGLVLSAAKSGEAQRLFAPPPRRRRLAEAG
jgi:DTW domain-containing protein YfiP